MEGIGLIDIIIMHLSMLTATPPSPGGGGGGGGGAKLGI